MVRAANAAADAGSLKKEDAAALLAIYTSLTKSSPFSKTTMRQRCAP